MQPEVSRLRTILSSPIFTSTAIALTIIIGGYVLIKKPFAHKEPLKVEEGPKSPTITRIDEKDTDKDGLPDWLEAAYQTDINNPDSDGDGTNDGAEIAQNRDPRRAGPDDALEKIATYSSSTDPKAAQEAYITSYIGKQARNIQAAVVSDLVKNFDVTQIADRYALSDLPISFDNSTSSLRKYGNEFSAVLLKYRYTGIGNETQIIEQALKSKKPSDLQKIELPAIQYRNVADDLRKITTPSSVAEAHLILVNGYDVMSRSLFLVTKIFEDPIAGGGGWQAYFTKSIKIADGYYGIVSKLIDNKIVFTKDEPGYYIQSKVK